MAKLPMLAAVLMALLGGAALADDLPAAKQTKLGLYLTAEETPRFLNETPQAIMVDVRTPREINETGIAEGVDALIPLAIIDGSKQMAANPDFEPGFMKLASIRNLSPDRPVVFNLPVRKPQRACRQHIVAARLHQPP